MESEDTKVELFCMYHSTSGQTPIGREGTLLLQHEVTLLHYIASRSEIVQLQQWDTQPPRART